MAADKLVQLEAQAKQAHQKLALMREGLEPGLTDDALGVRSWQPAPEIKRGTVLDGNGSRERIPFHKPMTRAHRLATASGVTSFHFAHSSINKVSTERMEEGRRNCPGAAKAHSAYIERETAVAVVATEIASDVEGPAIVAPPSTDRAGEAHEGADTAILRRGANVHRSDEEKERESLIDQSWDQFGGAAAGGPFLCGTFDHLGDDEPGVDAGSEANLRLLSGSELVRFGRKSEHLLRCDAEVPMDAGIVANPLSGTRTRTRVGHAAAPVGEVFAQSPSGHDRYIIRGNAIALQPDGDRALFTNIDANPAKRAEFWQLVDEHERPGGPDQMSCRFADQPEFWSDTVRHPDCPGALRSQYEQSNNAKIERFDIESGKKMRAFLAKQRGWITKSKRKPSQDDSAADACEIPFADFHDGRRGRTQYRIVGELPNDLSMHGRTQLLRDFAEEFRKRKIPFVAVMHAPDHHNDEKNWHFHLIYYDRPCARITAAQIAGLSRDGYDTANLVVGMWDFAAVTNKRDRVKRPATPLAQKKVTEVGNDRWIEKLRHRFAERTNAQLEKERVDRRVDPRRHADMGIQGDPQEHLGTKQAAAETRGDVTVVGTANEDRQSRAIEAAIDARRDVARTDTSKQIAAWKKRCADRPAIPSTSFAADLNDFHDSMMIAAALDHVAAYLRHGLDRAESRAMHVYRTNQRLVTAIDADPAAGSVRERQKRGRLVAAATEYLNRLDFELGSERSIVADCEKEAGALRTRAALAEVRLLAAVEARPVTDVVLSLTTAKPAEPAVPVATPATLTDAMER